ncbi:SiaB family protein kinase [Paracrocinitomix mangrovi]|uniref:SiaB family protein kinase n=1 Tax=Paracrocinitomix mangrovi TaxID=2862509 RepID=UPI001C8D5E61|nr:SiaB family protein kinase [Paracrocinitomix mangrovi]UKN01439.1 SiaB family protein kinase [Paracrocinitomix mangrovi]
MQAFKYFSILKHDNFSLLYMGEFDDDLTGLLMDIQETSSDEGRGTKKRVSYLIAECFQNIIRHTDDSGDEGEIDHKMFMMRNVFGTHYIATVNPVKNENIDSLRSSLDHLKSLSADDIKRIYLESLSNNTLSEKGGGGLGLIEMARKTKNPPQYHFSKINEEVSNFFMQLVMGGEVQFDSQLELDSTVDLYTELVKDDIIMLRKGDFSQETILPLFKLFESNLHLKQEDLVFKKKSLYILIELLQNMNRHGVEIKGIKEGIFTVSLTDGVYTMETGNFIRKDKVEKLKGHLSSLQGLDKKELSRRYKEKLLDNSVTEDQGAGIGIIEMFRQSDGEILFTFEEVDDELYFFTLRAKL